ncbi:type III polyketide synthase [Leifsonia sp. ALI-44-B]|uniref:type III polyketide synthase n=1 Tax=Leifsonia sp. ALI-44-B TaxID=1933776 RepID=UPI00097C6250|nr:type III polyketide synthase [Leifsonia sp. ALI-44-B]ONI63539.1 type III polyketide synthase [Leifsonia sp. ALI-44-B]
MPVSVRSLETAVPKTIIRQPDVRDLFRAQPGMGRLADRLIGAAFDASAIETRHTVLGELGGEFADDTEGVFLDRETGVLRNPTTGVRNEVYIDRSPELFLAAARLALETSGGLTAADVTHVVTVSCTGFFAPGPDYRLVRDLGLRASTQRYHLGFMGCYGAFPALRASRDFCLADPDAVVLVVSVELCSLHISSSNDPDTIVASSVFADGAAAAVVTSRDAPAGHPVLDLDAFETVLTPVGETDMAWKIGDHGFEMVLSSYVPSIIEKHIEGALDPLLARLGESRPEASADIERWAIHPGGRSILDKVQDAVKLSDAQMVESRRVLRDFGNMSSATVLFVLREILHDADAAGTGTGTGTGTSTSESAGNERVCAMAFGPGLTVESAILTKRVAG